MGVPGLWAVLRAAGTPRSLTNIAVEDGYNAEHVPYGAQQHPKAFRVGIDASIWFVHAEYGKEGENPELRTIFFRLARLLQTPFLPLFVFDGPLRPEMKRGKLIDMKPSWMIDGMKTMITAFGFEWRTAPGEAEAELAYLNRIGVIDAVLTDDVDTLVFGAKLVIRNQSKNLSGNRAHDLTNADGRDDKNHTMTFSLADIERHPDVDLSQAGLILIALLSGGDYSKGVEGCGPQVAAGLARCGFGDSLVTKVRSLSLSVSLNLQTTGSRKASKTRVTLGASEKVDLLRWLESWRDELCSELKTNSRGYLKKKSPSLATKILQANWLPDVQVLMAYVNPVTSEERAVAKALKEDTAVDRAKQKVAEELRQTIVWRDDPDIGAIARFCEDRFEWGVKDVIIKRFRSWLWAGIVCRMLRRAALIAVTERSRSMTPPMSQRTAAAKRLESLVLSSPRKGATRRSYEDERNDAAVIVKIHSVRSHASTDGLLEYRLEVDPAGFVRAAEEGIEGKRDNSTGWSDSGEDEDEEDEQGKKGKKSKGEAAQPLDHLRMWMPACMVRPVVPELVQAFEDKAAKKKNVARGKGARKTSAQQESGESEASLPKKARGKAQAGTVRQAQSAHEDEGRWGGLTPPSPRKKARAYVAAARPPPIPLYQDDSSEEGDDDDDDDDSVPVPTRPSLRTAEPAPPLGVPDFFKASKPATRPKPKNAVAGPSKSKSGTPAASSAAVARIASLFNDPEIQVFKDLTKRAERPPVVVTKPRMHSVPTMPKTMAMMPALMVKSRSAPGSSKASEYIEISSDSDEEVGPPPTSKPRPDLVLKPKPKPKAKAKLKSTETEPGTRPALRRAPLPSSEDVIDLCSDSD